MKGTRIKSISASSMLPNYELIEVNDVYPIYGMSLGGYLPLKDWHIEVKSFGITQRFNLGYSSGRTTNSVGLRGTYFYALQSQSYLSYKSGVGSVTTKQYGRKRAGSTGWGFGVGFQYGMGTTDYYKDRFNYRYLVPSLYVEFALEIKDLGITKLIITKSLGRDYTTYRSYMKRIQSVGITDFGITVSKVF